MVIFSLTSAIALQVEALFCLRLFAKVQRQTAFTRLWGFGNCEGNVHAWKFLKAVDYVLFCEALGKSFRSAWVPFLCWLLFYLNLFPPNTPRSANITYFTWLLASLGWAAFCCLVNCLLTFMLSHETMNLAVFL